MQLQSRTDQEVVDTVGAEAVTGLSRATLASLRCRGGGPPFFKLGRRVVYPLDELRRWRDARLVRSTAEEAPPIVDATLTYRRPMTLHGARRHPERFGGALATRAGGHVAAWISVGG